MPNIELFQHFIGNGIAVNTIAVYQNTFEVVFVGRNCIKDRSIRRIGLAFKTKIFVHLKLISKNLHSATFEAIQSEVEIGSITLLTKLLECS